MPSKHHNSPTITSQPQSEAATQAAAQAAAQSQIAQHQAEIANKKANYSSQISSKNSEVGASNVKIAGYQNEIDALTNISTKLSNIIETMQGEITSCQSKYENDIYHDWKGSTYNNYNGEYKTMESDLNFYKSDIAVIKLNVDNLIIQKKAQIAWERSILSQALAFISQLESAIASLF
jgi:chromosome segregation ATPase